VHPFSSFHEKNASNICIMCTDFDISSWKTGCDYLPTWLESGCQLVGLLNKVKFYYATLSFLCPVSVTDISASLMGTIRTNRMQSQRDRMQQVHSHKTGNFWGITKCNFIVIETLRLWHWGYPK